MSEEKPCPGCGDEKVNWCRVLYTWEWVHEFKNKPDPNGFEGRTVDRENSIYCPGTLLNPWQWYNQQRYYKGPPMLPLWLEGIF